VSLKKTLQNQRHEPKNILVADLSLAASRVTPVTMTAK
jgi:hypothetical protein